MAIDATAKFSDVYQSFERQDLKDNKHLRMQDGKGLYVHSGFSLPKMFDFYGKHAARRAEKQANAGQGVWQSIANQHGKEVADKIFRNVLKSDRADHKVAVTWRDMQRIKQALPGAVHQTQLDQVKQSAVRLAADGDTKATDLDRFASENLDLLSSPEFTATFHAKTRSDELHTMRAFACFDRINSDGYTRHDFDQFLKEIGVDPAQIPEKEKTKLPQITDFGVLREETKQWMADKLHQQCFKSGGAHQLNLESGEDRREFSRKYESFQGSSADKLAMLRGQYHSIIQRDVGEISRGIAKGISEMQGQSTDAINDAVDREYNAGMPHKAKLRQYRCSIRNRQLVRKFLPGTARFNKLANQQDINPKHLLHQERRYISDRLQMLAAQRARTGEEVDGNWARTEVTKALKELELHGPELANTHQQAAAAAHSVMRGLLNPGSMTPDELAAKTMEFVFRCKDYQQKLGRMGTDAFLEDVNSFLQTALRSVPKSPHADPINVAAPLLYAAHLASADHAVNSFSEFSGYMESGIEHHTNDLARVLQEAVGQIADQTQTPQLKEQFRQLNDTAYRTADQLVEAERSRGDRKFEVNRKVPLPGGAAKGVGASNDELYAAAGTILKLASEREESQKDVSARKDSSADYDPNDLKDENVHVNERYQS